MLANIFHFLKFENPKNSEIRTFGDIEIDRQIIDASAGRHVDQSKRRVQNAQSTRSRSFSNCVICEIYLR